MGSSLIQMPSTEDVGKNNLDLRINHRFGNARNTTGDFLGLDNGANTQIALDYGITDRLSVGFARTSFFKTYELRGKYRLLTQDKDFPFTLAIYGVAGQETNEQRITLPNYINPPSTGIPTIDSQIRTSANQYELSDNDKRSYLGSILISRKFTDRISLQISPMFVHRNFVKTNLSNDRMGLDVGGRIKITKRFDFTFEAIFLPKRDYVGDRYATLDQQSEFGITQLTSDQINAGLNGGSLNPGTAYAQNVILDKKVPHLFTPFSLGFDLETGGHVFQFFVTNSRALAQTQLLRGAEFDYFKKDWTVGFNIHRYFSLGDDEIQ